MGHHTDNLKQMLRPFRGAIRLLCVVPLRAFIRYVPFRTGKLFLWNTFASHVWWLETFVVAPTRSGIALQVDARESLGRFVYYFGLWEPNLTNWLSGRIKSGDTVIDVGANVGYFTSLASALVGNTGAVVALEAFPPIFEQLNWNLAKNEAKNVRALNIAVWDSITELPIFADKEHPAGNTTVVPAWASIHHLKTQGLVPAAPLTSLLSPEEVKNTRLIKVDVEGAEWRIIPSLLSVVREARKDVEIVMEVTEKLSGSDAQTPNQMLKLFLNEGFNCYLLENNYSASAYVNFRNYTRPKRVHELKNQAQYDVVFSRVDVAEL